MKTFRTIQSIQKFLQPFRGKNKTIGFVPTMGALHAGHLALIRKARRENNIVAVSIFVNPAQFGPAEDFKKYPRQIKQDSLLLKIEDVDVLFYPTVTEMYPSGYLTNIRIERLTEGLCGQYRPGHFDGVATVVAKFLHIVSPNVMYLGQKDAQQVAVLRQMVTDLNMPVRISVVSTVREADGLAMSSRNKYLTPEQRAQAPVIWQALQQAKKDVMRAEFSPREVEQRISRHIQKNSCGKIQYVRCVDHQTLAPMKSFRGKVLIAVAAYFGSTRLIDNIIFQIHDDSKRSD